MKKGEALKTFPLFNVLAQADASDAKTSNSPTDKIKFLRPSHEGRGEGTFNRLWERCQDAAAVGNDDDDESKRCETNEFDIFPRHDTPSSGSPPSDSQRRTKTDTLMGEGLGR